MTNRKSHQFIHSSASNEQQSTLQAGTTLADGCILGMFSFPGGFGAPSWILGDTFIRAFCNTYDLGGKRLGLSKALM